MKWFVSLGLLAALGLSRLQDEPVATQTRFQTASATCAVCHKLFGQGTQIGPDPTACQRDL